MFEHIIHRLAAAALVLLAVSFVTYLMLNAAPGDLALTLVGDSASAEQLTALRQELGLMSRSSSATCATWRASSCAAI